MPDCAKHRANSNFQLIMANQEEVVVSKAITLRGVRINFQTNSLTNNNVKPKQVILKMKEVGLLEALNHPMIQGGAHTSQEIVEEAATIKVVNPADIRHQNRMKTIRIPSQLKIQTRREILLSRFSFRGLERTRVSCLTRGLRWTERIWLKNVIEWESHLAASILKTFRTCLNNLRKSKLRLRQKVHSKIQQAAKVHSRLR